LRKTRILAELPQLVQIVERLLKHLAVLDFAGQLQGFLGLFVAHLVVKELRKGGQRNEYDR
jgi:hypothetical protein